MSDLDVFTTQADKEIAQLKAQVALLREELQFAKAQYMNCDCGHPRCSIERDGKEAQEAIDQSPAHSLAEIEAAALERVAGYYPGAFWAQALIDEANRLRQEVSNS